MIGPKTGDALVVFGAGEPDLTAALALITGLNGQTLVIDDAPDARTRVESAAASAGALIEIADSASPDVVSDSFDLAVIVSPLGVKSPQERGRIVTEAVRLLRPGGRTILLDGTKRRGFLTGFGPKPVNTPTDEVLDLFEQAGHRVRRKLGDAEGVSYYEGIKGRG